MYFLLKCDVCSTRKFQSKILYAIFCWKIAINIACEQAFGRAGSTGLWSSGELGEREKRKGLWTNIWDRSSTAPAVHQILMQALIGENTDCWQVWLTSAFRWARSTRFDIKVAITKRAPLKRLTLSLEKHWAGIYRVTMQFSIVDVASV